MSPHHDPAYLTGQTVEDLLRGAREEYSFYRLRCLDEQTANLRLFRECRRRWQLTVWALERAVASGEAPPAP